MPMLPWIVLPLPVATAAPRPDDVVRGPTGCFVTSGEVAWAHTSGRWRWSGVATFDVRFADRIWHLDGVRIRSQESDPPLSEDRGIGLSPLLVGHATDSGLAYWETRRRWFAWAPPVVTEPMRTWGEVQTTYIDQQADTTTWVQTSSFRGYKDVEAARSTTFDGDRAVALTLQVEESRPGACRLSRVGRAELGAVGLPRIEGWDSEVRCPLRNHAQSWSFRFGPWRPCEAAAPSR